MIYQQHGPDIEIKSNIFLLFVSHSTIVYNIVDFVIKKKKKEKQYINNESNKKVLNGKNKTICIPSTKKKYTLVVALPPVGQCSTLAMNIFDVYRKKRKE